MGDPDPHWLTSSPRTYPAPTPYRDGSPADVKVDPARAPMNPWPDLKQGVMFAPVTAEIHLVIFEVSMGIH